MTLGAFWVVLSAAQYICLMRGAGVSLPRSLRIKMVDLMMLGAFWVVLSAAPYICRMRGAGVSLLHGHLLPTISIGS